MKTIGQMGADRNLNQLRGTPQITSAMLGWASRLILVRIAQEIIDGFVQEIIQQIEFQGVVQPLSPKQIMLKPEGERAWTWLQIHIQANSPVKLTVGDKIMYNCERYKVMARLDYSANNYIELHCVQDFQNG